MSSEDLLIVVPAALVVLLVLAPVLWENHRERVKRGDDPRVWFYRPEWYWFGWRTLVPFAYGHDEYARRVLVFGWPITGQVCIAVWGCGDPECKEDAERYRRDLRQMLEEESHG